MATAAFIISLGSAGAAAFAAWAAWKQAHGVREQVALVKQQVDLYSGELVAKGSARLSARRPTVERAGDVLAVDFFVKNIGAASAEGVEVWLEDRGGHSVSPRTRLDHPTLGPGEEDRVSFRLVATDMPDALIPASSWKDETGPTGKRSDLEIALVA